MEFRTLHRKKQFWRIERDGLHHRVTFGRIGREGRELLREFETEEQSERVFAKRVDAMQEKGYELVESSEPAAPDSAPVIELDLPGEEVAPDPYDAPAGDSYAAEPTEAAADPYADAEPDPYAAYADYDEGGDAPVEEQYSDEHYSEEYSTEEYPDEEPAAPGYATAPAEESYEEVDEAGSSDETSEEESYEQDLYADFRGDESQDEEDEIERALAEEEQDTPALPDDIELELASAYSLLPPAQRLAVQLFALFDSQIDLRVLGVLTKQDSLPARFAKADKATCRAAVTALVETGHLNVLDEELYSMGFGLASELEKIWAAIAADTFDFERKNARLAMLETYADLANWFCHTLKSGHIETALGLFDRRQQALESAAELAMEIEAYTPARLILQALNLHGELRSDPSVRQLFRRCREWLEETGLPDLESERGEVWLFLLQADVEALLAAGSDTSVAELDSLIARVKDQAAPSAQKVLGWSYNQHGTLSREAGDYDAARAWFGLAIEVHKGLREEKGLTASYHQLAEIERLEGRLDQAEAWLEACAAIETRLQDSAGMARTCEQLGRLAEAKGNFTTAERHLKDSVRIKFQRGDRAGLLSSYRSLGNVAFRQRKLDEAEDWYKKAQEISEALGETDGLVPIYRRLGRVALEQGNFADAEKFFRYALQQRSGDRTEMAKGYHLLGTAALVGGKLADAEQSYRLALAILEAHGSSRELLAVLFELAALAEMRTATEDAEKWHARFDELCAKISEVEGGQPDEVALDSVIQAMGTFPRTVNQATSAALETLGILSDRLGTDQVRERWRAQLGEELPEPFAAQLLQSRRG